MGKTHTLHADNHSSEWGVTPKHLQVWPQTKTSNRDNDNSVYLKNFQYEHDSSLWSGINTEHSPPAQEPSHREEGQLHVIPYLDEEAAVGC